jgi:hypothetical protein
MIEDISERKERPAYVQFETRTEEDKAASARENRYVVREYEVAKLTPPYSKDSIEFHVDTWLADIEKNLRDGRISEDWAKYWRDAYRNWKSGQELPLSGTPIKGWGVISQAQQESLIHINCKTVEDLALVNEEGMRRMGMGALDLRNKAQAWLKSMNDHGGATLKIAALEQENAVLRTSVESLEKKVAALVAAQPADEPPISYDNVHEITSSELLDAAEPAAPTRSRRRLTPAAAA